MKLDPLSTFYLIGALMMVLTVIIAYPTIREKSKRK